MKRIIIVLVVLISASTLFAQQQPLYSQYMFNRFLLNPAITGNVDYIPIRLTARQQWVGITGAPSTQAISAHTLLGNKNMGVGGYIYADRFGPETKIGIQASYAYIVPLNAWNSKLSFGLAVKAFQYQLDYTAMDAIDDGDNALSGESKPVFVPDADFGVYLEGERYFAGISAAQLIELPIKMEGEEVEKNSMIRHYYLLGGYKFQVGEQFELEPSILAKGTERTPFNLDVNVRGIYLENYWAGVSYRTSGEIIGMVGIKYNGFIFGYAFDYSTSEIKNFQSGSHEIMIGYNIGEGKNKGSSLL